jgi:hypothetical protein
MAHVPFRKRSQLGSSAAHRDTEGGEAKVGAVPAM